MHVSFFTGRYSDNVDQVESRMQALRMLSTYKFCEVYLLESSMHLISLNYLAKMKYFYSAWVKILQRTKQHINHNLTH